MERTILNSLKFVLSVPTPYMFMSKFLSMAKSGEIPNTVSFFLLDLCLVEYWCLRFRQSLLTAYITVHGSTSGDNPNKVIKEDGWINDMHVFAGHSKEQLIDCAALMVRLHEKASMGSVENLNTPTAVCDKYSGSRHFSASRTLVALSILSSTPNPYRSKCNIVLS